MQPLTRQHRHAAALGHSPQRRGRRNPIADIYGNTIVLFLPLVALSLALSPPDVEPANWYNGTAPIYSAAVTSFAAFRVARAVPAALWSPAFWLLASATFFFGIGPLVEVYGNNETQIRLSAHKLATTEIELFKSNLLSFVSILGLLVGFWLHTRSKTSIWRAAFMPLQTRQTVVLKPATLALAFIIGGMILVHGLIKPSQWGQLNILVPGVLTSIAPIVDVGFALAAYLAVLGSKRMWLVLALLWPAHLLLSVLSFSKAALTLALMLVAIGAYLGHRRMIWLALSALVIAGVYGVSQDFVHYGRIEILNETGFVAKAGYGERLEITRRYFTEELSNDDGTRAGEKIEGWWMRLNFSGVQAVGMRFREDGMFIDTLSGVWMMFIPRLIWPDKPVYEGPGLQFYTLITGNSGPAVGLSVFGDIYWQFGWTGVVLITPLIGWLMAMMAWRSIEAIEQRNFVRMPLVLLSILFPAMGLTKWLANGIIAMISMYISYILLIHAIEWLVRTQQRSRRVPPVSLGRLR